MPGGIPMEPFYGIKSVNKINLLELSLNSALHPFA